jgi:DNA-binding LytR/AlgR family response regulator
VTFVFWIVSAAERQAARGARRAPAILAPDTVRLREEPRFLDRLPKGLGRDLLALEMEDHYVRAHMAAGSALVLMRMRDAVAELDGMDGLQVHRSWWVARAAVEGTVQDGRNIRLRLKNGIEAPVARANQLALRDSGWL